MTCTCLAHEIQVHLVGGPSLYNSHVLQCGQPLPMALHVLEQLDALQWSRDWRGSREEQRWMADSSRLLFGSVKIEMAPIVAVPIYGWGPREVRTRVLQDGVVMLDRYAGILDAKISKILTGTRVISCPRCRENTESRIKADIKHATNGKSSPSSSSPSSSPSSESIGDAVMREMLQPPRSSGRIKASAPRVSVSIPKRDDPRQKRANARRSR